MHSFSIIHYMDNMYIQHRFITCFLLCLLETKLKLAIINHFPHERLQSTTRLLTTMSKHHPGKSQSCMQFKFMLN